MRKMKKRTPNENNQKEIKKKKKELTRKSPGILGWQ